MNSLFLRIYWGLLISLLLISITGYLTLQTVNSYRYEQYLKSISQGVLTVLTDHLSGVVGEERFKWIAEVSGFLGARVELKRRDQIDLLPMDTETLNLGEIVFKVVNPDGIAQAHIAIPNEDFILVMELEPFSEQQAIGQAKLLEHILKQHPLSEWPQKIANFIEHFGFPLALGDLDSVAQESLYLDRLKRGDIVVNWGGIARDTSTLHLISPIRHEGSNVYLVMGPVPIFNWFPLHFTLIIGVLALVFLGMAGYLLVKPLESGMTRMEKAISRIRSGDLNARAYIDSNDALGHLAMTINDMAEHIQRLIKSQREMTNAVSHELRTPVARIRFGLEYIEDCVQDPSIHKQISLIDNDIEELNKLIDEILTYANLEEGRPALQLEELDVESILEQVKKESLAQGHNKEIELLRHQYEEKDSRRFAECERRYIHRVAQNLVNNAVRYAKSKVRIHCACEGNMYRIDVEDDGPGIPQEKWEAVFTPFARLDTSRNRKSGGYGLGLSIVRSIAYWHGGVAGVYSSDLGGAKFTVIWPRTQEIRVTFDEDANG